MSYDKTKQSIKNIYNSVWEWVNTIAPSQLKGSDSGVDYSKTEWVIGYQNGYLPSRPFGTIFIDNSSRRLSMNNTRYEYDESKGKFKEITSMSLQIILNLNMYGTESDFILSNIFLTIDTQEVKDWFYSNGIRYNYRGQVSNTSALINKQYEDRAQVDLILYTVFENVNYIDNIAEVSIIDDDLGIHERIKIND